VALLAISFVNTACPAADGNSVINQLAIISGKAIPLHVGAASTTDASAGTCGSVAGTLLKTCCNEANTKDAVGVELGRVKAQYETFGTSVYRFGALMAKALLLINSTTTNTTLAAVTDAGQLAGATADQLKTFTYYTPTQFTADYDAYKAQVVGCFDYHSASVQKMVCAACMDTAVGTAHANHAANFGTDAIIRIKTDACTEWATKCNRVWNFLHKASWFIQTTALLNKKKDTGTAYTFAPVTTNAGYAAGHDTLANIILANDACGGADITVADVTKCTVAFRTSLCKSFIGMFAGTVSAAGVLVGRSSTVFIVDGHNPTSLAARRMLIAAATGAVDVTATGVDLVAMGATIIHPPTTAVALATGTTWSHGYVATTTTAAGTTGTTANNAKVVIGTILSALFAIALLN
jgi:hypothetical protein